MRIERGSELYKAAVRSVKRVTRYGLSDGLAAMTGLLRTFLTVDPEFSALSFVADTVPDGVPLNPNEEKNIEALKAELLKEMADEN